MNMYCSIKRARSTADTVVPWDEMLTSACKHVCNNNAELKPKKKVKTYNQTVMKQWRIVFVCLRKPNCSLDLVRFPSVIKTDFISAATSVLFVYCVSCKKAAETDAPCLLWSLTSSCMPHSSSMVTQASMGKAISLPLSAKCSSNGFP